MGKQFPRPATNTSGTEPGQNTRHCERTKGITRKNDTPSATECRISPMVRFLRSLRLARRRECRWFDRNAAGATEWTYAVIAEGDVFVTRFYVAVIAPRDEPVASQSGGV